MLLEQIDLLKNLYDLPLNPWRRSGKEGTPLWLRSPDAIISLKVVRCVGDVNEQHQVMGSTKNRPTWYQSQPRRVTVFRSLRSRVFFSRKPEIILGRLRSPGDVFNVMATPDFPFIAEHRNIASISRPCDTFERSTCRIEGVMCDEDLLHEMHLCRHAEEIHRLSTQRNYYIKDTGSDIDTD